MATTLQNIETPKRWRAWDTSGNNNHGQIYSGRGLEFDGVTDYLTIPSTSPYYDYDSDNGNGISNQAWTMATWMYIDDVDNDTYQCIMGWQSDTHVNYGTGIMLKNDGTIFANAAHNVTTFYDDRYTTALQEKTWYRVVATSSGDGAGQTVKLYLNGVNVQSTTGTTGDYAYKFAIGAGRQNDSTTNGHFEGKLSDAQIWNTEWSADDVAFDYANPEQLALNRGGTSLTNSNLKLWYPMNDGHRGQQSYVLDASNTGLGDNLLVNSDMELDSDWADYSSPDTNERSTEQVYSGTYSRKLVGSSGKGITQTVTGLTAGGSYLMEAYVYPNGTSVELQSDNGAVTHTVTPNEWNKISMYINQPDTSGIFRVRSHNSTTTYIDNFKLYPVNDKNHATTVFYGDNLIANSDFETDVSNWSSSGSLSSGPTHNTSHAKVGAESLSFVASAAEGGVKSAKYTTVTGRRYKVDFWAKPLNSETKIRHVIMEGDGSGWINAADFTLSSYSTATGTVGSGNWYNLTYEYTEASGGTDAEIRILSASDDSDGTFAIDEVSIKEIGTASGWTDADQQLDIPQTALQSYNQLAWFPGQADTYVQLTDPYNYSSITVSAWVCLLESATTKCIFANRDSAEDGILFYISNNEALIVKIGDNLGTGSASYVGTGSSVIPTDGSWTHVSFTFDGTNMKLYVNGEKQTAATGNEVHTDAPVTLGVTTNAKLMKDSQANAYWNGGSITEVSIWNKAFTQADINEVYNDGKALDATTHSSSPSTGTDYLKGYFRNNGLATWTDLSGEGNNGTPTNVAETIIQQAGVDASRDCQGFLMNRKKDTNALNLADGLNTVDDVDNIIYAAMKDNPLDLSEDFSVSLWFKPHRFYTSGAQTFIQLNDDDDNHFAISTIGDDNKIGVSIETAAGGLSRSVSASGDSTNIDEGKWTHVVVCGSSGVSTGNNSATLVDSGAAWIVDELIGGRVWDDIDNQGATITDNTATVVTGALSGSDDWDTDDKYTITKVYVNGSVNTQTITDSTSMFDGTDLNNTYFIGSDNTAQRQFNGQIDDVICYQKWLTEDEVKRNYNAGKRSHRNPV